MIKPATQPIMPSMVVTGYFSLHLMRQKTEKVRILMQIRIGQAIDAIPTCRMVSSARIRMKY